MTIESGQQIRLERIRWTFLRNQSIFAYVAFRILHRIRKTFFISNAPIFPRLVRKLRSLNSATFGATITLNCVPKEMYSKPFVLDFRNYFFEISNGFADLDLVNIYTVGRRYPPFKFRQDSYFLDPFSKFKDSWFGIFILKNDDEGRGRKFILNDPFGDPSDFNNVNPDGIEYLMKADQKIICFNSFMNFKNLPINELWNDFQSKFYFKKNRDVSTRIVNRKEEVWLQFERDYDTISALTDRRKTKMRQRDGIAAYIGLPDSHQYRHVSPWHEITLTGKCTIKYFSEFSAWFIVYYNGVRFKMKNGMEIDTNKNSDLQNLYEKMFQNFSIKFYERDLI